MPKLVLRLWFSVMRHHVVWLVGTKPPHSLNIHCHNWGQSGTEVKEQGSHDLDIRSRSTKDLLKRSTCIGNEEAQTHLLFYSIDYHANSNLTRFPINGIHRNVRPLNWQRVLMVFNKQHLLPHFLFSTY